MRNKTLQLSLDEFMKSSEYAEMDIWDLKYISTSDEEDNDSDMASEGEASSEGDDDKDSDEDEDSEPNSDDSEETQK